MMAEEEPEPDFLSSARVAVLGLGLMGGSLAMALRGKCKQLLGIDPNPATLKLAERLSLCDLLSTDPCDILPSADLIVLAAPIHTIIDLIHQLPSLTPASPIVMDLGSTKVQIMRAMEGLPERFDPIGAHPMCGKEQSSLEQAEAVLYKDAAFALVPLPRTSSRARVAVEELVRAAGAHPIWLNEITHDRWVAATSHVPFLVANALASVTPPEVAPMVGPGYRSTTRVATSPASVMLDILSTNRANILDGLGRVRAQLEHLETLLREENQSELALALDAGAARQNQILLSST